MGAPSGLGDLGRASGLGFPMTGPAQDRKADWLPPKRPDWVARLNEEGNCLDIAGIVPLDEASLLSTAMRNTGLTDFGTDDWIEPFRVFIKSMDADAELNLMGRLMGRSDILQFLEARLRIEDTYRRHPEIDDQEIRAPLFITGLERSGTSILHQLLTQIPENGTVKCWEAVFPCPPPEKATYLTDPRIAKADMLLRQNFRVTPTYENAYQMGGDLPTECIHFMCMSFVSLWLAALGQVQGYLQYYMTQGAPLWEIGYRYHKRILKLLQWKNPRQQWILKSPVHLGALPTLFKVYPDARVVWSHRDPVKAFASGLDLMGLLQWVRSDHPLKGGFEHLRDIEVTAQMLCRPIDWIESGAVPKGQLCSTRFREFTENPISAVEKIYQFFDMSLSASGRQAMEAYMLAHPRSKRGHVYSDGTQTLISHERQVLRRYQEYFKVPDETV
jgi:Sulfotransferase family